MEWQAVYIHWPDQKCFFRTAFYAQAPCCFAFHSYRASVHSPDCFQAAAEVHVCGTVCKGAAVKADACPTQVSLCLTLSYYQNNLADREKSAVPYCFVCLLAVIDLTYLLLRFCFSPLHLSPGCG